MNNSLLFQKIYRDHTKSTTCVVRGCTDAKTVWFVVNDQQFCVTPEPTENDEQAEFMRRSLAAAIVSLIQENCGRVKP